MRTRLEHVLILSTLLLISAHINEPRKEIEILQHQKFVIPVVVHVVFKDAAENLPDARIISNINSLNEDLRRMPQTLVFNTKTNPRREIMKIRILLWSLCSLLFVSCSLTSDVEPPEAKDISAIEYFEFNLGSNVTFTATRDSVRCKAESMDSYGKWTTLDTVLFNQEYLPSLVSTIPLQEFWNMDDIPSPKNISSDSRASINITATSRQASPTSPATTINKMVRSETSSFPESMKTTRQIIDSMIVLLTHRQ
jgi:hypothetical protein